MTDPFLAAARHVVDTSLTDMRAGIDGLSRDALNWRPAADDTNSIAVLAFHTMSSTRSWLSVAVGAPLPERDRPSEFRIIANDPAELLAWLDDMAQQCRALFAGARDVDWSAMRKTHARPDSDDPDHVPAAWALLHAIDHLREHAGQIALTRQLLRAV